MQPTQASLIPSSIIPSSTIGKIAFVVGAIVVAIILKQFFKQ
jgi:hypothetical protein